MYTFYVHIKLTRVNKYHDALDLLLWYSVNAFPQFTETAYSYAFDIKRPKHVKMSMSHLTMLPLELRFTAQVFCVLLSYN